MRFEDHFSFMLAAIEEAEQAGREKEVPIGAVVVDQQGTIVGRGYNQKETTSNPCAHAEIIAIEQACRTIENWRLNNHVIYSTLEPCPMCLAAIREARLSLLVFGAYDNKGGALSLGYCLHDDHRLNHRFSVLGGILESDCRLLLQDFFKSRR